MTTLNEELITDMGILSDEVYDDKYFEFRVVDGVPSFPLSEIKGTGYF